MGRIVLNGVGLDIPVYGAGTRHIRAALLEMLTGRRSKSSDHQVLEVRTLDRISLEISSGDRVALIGHNGAGKTTLLRVMAGIFEPTSGSIMREGRIQTIFDVASGMEEEATGRENILIRARYMGASAKQARDRVDDVVDFAELGTFIDLPIRTYSAGMRLRLAFGIATTFEADVLLLDEILGVGDAAFAAKSQQRMTDIISRAGAVVIATHAMSLSDAVARRGILMHGGRVIGDGDYQQITGMYLKIANRPARAA